MPSPLRVRYAKIRELRDRLLEKYGVTRPATPMVKIAEGEGLRIERREFEDDWSGFLLRGSDKAIIGVNAKHGVNRQRFTIAHELGHFLLHDGETLHVDKSFKINFRDVNSSLGTGIEEIESNTFAAYLLMPESFLMPDVREEHLDINDESAIAELAKRYQVSAQAMTFRLMNLVNEAT